MERWYYLTAEPFEQINRGRPPAASGRGRPPTVKHREALEGILHILRTGPPWREVPPAAGPWHTLDRRWQRGLERGGWANILRLLQRLQGVDRKNGLLDSTVGGAHPHAAGAAPTNAIRPAAALAAG